MKKLFFFFKYKYSEKIALKIRKAYFEKSKFAFNFFIKIKSEKYMES